MEPVCPDCGEEIVDYDHIPKYLCKEQGWECVLCHSEVEYACLAMNYAKQNNPTWLCRECANDD